MVHMTVKRLFALMEGRFRNFPNDYLVLDTETTGVVFGDDLIWQIGHCFVRNSLPVDRGNVLLDWTRHPRVQQNWLRQRIEATRRHVEYDKDGRPTGKKFHITYERMRDEGVSPEPILQEYLAWFEELHEDQVFFVAHNGYHFDAEMLTSHFWRFLGKRWGFDDGELMDTGMVLKAAQSSLVPWTGETLQDFSRRAYSQRLRGVRWALDQYAVPKFGLDKKYGLDMSQAHDAGFDAYVTHLLFQEFVEFARSGELKAT
jgi:DNA polymerase III epsilon subunit-like protein